MLVQLINTVFYIHISCRKDSAVEYSSSLPPWFLTLPSSDRATCTKIIRSFPTLQPVCGLTADQHLGQNIQIVWQVKGKLTAVYSNSFLCLKDRKNKRFHILVLFFLPCSVEVLSRGVSTFNLITVSKADWEKCWKTVLN